jgi:hypothetical protein
MGVGAKATFGPFGALTEAAAVPVAGADGRFAETGAATVGAAVAAAGVAAGAAVAAAGA